MTEVLSLHSTKSVTGLVAPASSVRFLKKLVNITWPNCVGRWAALPYLLVLVVSKSRVVDLVLGDGDAPERLTSSLLVSWLSPQVLAHRLVLRPGAPGP